MSNLEEWKIAVIKDIEESSRKLILGIWHRDNREEMNLTQYILEERGDFVFIYATYNYIFSLCTIRVGILRQFSKTQMLLTEWLTIQLTN